MPKPYGQEAIDLCRSLYCKYGGKNHDAIQAEMRKAGYAGWQKANLHDRGKEGTSRWRMGWIGKYGFDESLKTHVRLLVDNVKNDDQRDYLKLQELCSRLESKALNPDAKKDDLYIYRDFFRLKLEMKTKLEVSRDNFETFVDCYEKLVGWLAQIDSKTAKMLVKHGEKLAELAQAHYGKTEGFDSGTIPEPDESSDGPAAGTGRVRK